MFYFNRHYNIIMQPVGARARSVPVPINIGKADYREENEAEWLGLGNVAIATTGERLFLREPLAIRYQANPSAITSADLPSRRFNRPGLLITFKTNTSILRLRMQALCEQ